MQSKLQKLVEEARKGPYYKYKCPKCNKKDYEKATKEFLKHVDEIQKTGDCVEFDSSICPKCGNKLIKK